MKKGNPWALLPILCFLVVFIGMGVWLNDFYAMPAIVGFLIALGVAFCQNRKRSFSEKMEDVTHSMGDSNVMIMCLVFVIQIPALESFVFILIHHNCKVIPVKLRKCLQSGKGLCHRTERNDKHTNFIF